MDSKWKRVVLSVLLAGFCSTALAQQAEPPGEATKAPAAKEMKATSSDGVAAAKQPVLRGRLPRYYGKLVDDAQRQQIYQIQASYRERISQLQAELAKLQMQQLEEIEGTLTADQRKQLDELRDVASRRTSSSSLVSSVAQEATAESKQ